MIPGMHEMPAHGSATSMCCWLYIVLVLVVYTLYKTITAVTFCTYSEYTVKKGLLPLFLRCSIDD